MSTKLKSMYMYFDLHEIRQWSLWTARYIWYDTPKAEYGPGYGIIKSNHTKFILDSFILHWKWHYQAWCLLPWFLPVITRLRRIRRNTAKKTSPNGIRSCDQIHCKALYPKTTAPPDLTTDKHLEISNVNVRKETYSDNYCPSYYILHKMSS